MPLAASEVRLLKAIRKIFENGETVVSPVYGVFETHNISMWTAVDEAEKYFQGSYAAYRVAKERFIRKLMALPGRRGFWARHYLNEVGYAEEFYRQASFGGGQIVSGNVSEETFNNWCVLATMAYIDRIIETGEVK
jgi:hypothetical protein